jgi:phospholipid/cholesterol/gamma-HCH transport system substrate-binding protein
MQSNPFKAGLFIIISFAVAIALFFGITGSSLFTGKHLRYTVAFDLTEDVGGLDAGADVRIGGLKVGTVKSVRLDNSPAGQRVVAVFSVPEQYALRQGTSVGVQSGLTGMVNLNISSLGTGTAISEADAIDGTGAALTLAIEGARDIAPEIRQTLADLRPRINSVMDDVKQQTIPRLNASLDQFKTTAANADTTILKARDKIDPVVDRYNGVADSARTALDHFGAIFGDTKTDFRTTMTNLASATTSVKDKLPVLLDKVGSTLDNVNDTVVKTRDALTGLSEITTNTKNATASVRSILAGNRTRIDEIIRNVNSTSQNLSAASGEIRRSPWRLLYTPKPGEVANQNLYDAARQFSEGSIRLHDAATAVRDAATDPNADPAQLKKLFDDLNGSFEQYKKVESELWNRLQK